MNFMDCKIPSDSDSGMLIQHLVDPEEIHNPPKVKAPFEPVNVIINQKHQFNKKNLKLLAS